MGLEFRRLRWDRGCWEAPCQEMSILELCTAHALSDERLSETCQTNRRHVRDFRAPTQATSPTGNRVERLWNHRYIPAQLHYSAQIATAITAVLAPWALGSRSSDSLISRLDDVSPLTSRRLGGGLAVLPVTLACLGARGLTLRAR
jgi:hypothetical protein